MFRIHFVAVIVALTIASADCRGEKPNIILIFSDDHGYTDLGVQGIRDDLKTPHLDKLAKGGVRFTNGYVSAPQCVPSRAGLLTGIYQNRFGVEANKHPLDGFGKSLTIAERLKKVGYVTGMTGKWHLGPASEIVKHGFDWVYYKNSQRPGWSNYGLDGNKREPGPENSKLYHIDANSRATCAFIEKNHRNPFFFYCAYRAPHVPLDAPKKYLDRFKGKMPQRRRQALAMISAMDDGVGEIMKTLRRFQLEEKTLVFFIGDNGAPLKIHKIDAPGGGPGWDGSLNDPLNGEKGMLSEGGIRVPFVASWKGKIPAGQVFDRPVISLDVAATAVSMAGVQEDPQLDGTDLIPWLTKSVSKVPDRKLYWRWVSQSAIRQGKWKFLKGGSYEYLFDLKQDPEEKNNLIKSKPEIAKRLKKDLVEWSADLKPPGITKTGQASTWNRYFEHYLEGNPEPRPKQAPVAASVDGWLCRNGTLKKEKGKLVVTGKGKNPFLVRNQISLTPGSSVELQIESRKQGHVGVSWRAVGQRDFNNEQVVFKQVSASENLQTVKLKMDSDKKVIHLRILLPNREVQIQSIRFVDKEDSQTQRWNFD